MYLAVEFDYSDVWKTMTEEEYLQLRQSVVSLPEKKDNYRPYPRAAVTVWTT